MAGFSVGRLAGLLLEPAPEGDVSKTTLRCGLGNRGTGDQCRNHLVLFAAEFFTVSSHLRSPAVIWSAEPATGMVEKSITPPDRWRHPHVRGHRSEERRAGK